MKSVSNIRYCLVITMCLCSLACTGQLFRNYGRITPAEETTRAFESYYVNPAYRYYISGSDAFPNALMGVHRDYRIDPAALWKEVPMTPAKMKEFVDMMKQRARNLGMFQHGFAITDDKGQQIGVWYSILEARTLVRMQENGTVRIDTPRLDLYERFERHDGREIEIP